MPATGLFSLPFCDWCPPDRGRAAGSLGRSLPPVSPGAPRRGSLSSCKAGRSQVGGGEFRSQVRGR
eukprot:698836-Prorocentrum_minimum.AAC.1